MKLSICIPTYNRSKYIGSFLEKVFLEIESCKLSSEVEVIVSDNCSPDDTEQVCQKFLARGLKYSKNAENIGPDANFLKLFELAQGEYIWLPGDDDSFSDNLLPYVFAAAKKEDFDYFYLRTVGEEPTVDKRNYSVVNNVELFGKTTIFTTFMTSQIIKASLLKPYIEDSRKYLGGFMAYYYIFARALENSKVCLISNQREISMTVDNTGGYNFYRVWGDTVFASLYATKLVENKKEISRFKIDMFIILILSVTYKLRRGSSGSNFVAGYENFNIEKYFDGSVYKLIFKIYKTAPIFLVTVLHGCIKVGNKFRRKALGLVC